MSKILILEDDCLIASGLFYALEQEGYAPVHVKSVGEAKAAILNSKFDLCVLDMQLPDGIGFEIQDALKNTGTAIIFLTVASDEGNVVRAFECGAADYITKPFRLRELLARVKRALNANGGTPVLTLNGVKIDTAAGKVYLNDTLLELTALEYRLLLTFASNKGRLLSRAQILENIWDAAGNFVEDNTLTVYIKRLREKLGGAVNIETIRGVGYRAD